MADGRPRARPGLRRGGHHSARAAAQTGSGVESNSNSVKSTLAKKRRAVFPDLKNGTPRLLLRRVMRNQPQVSPLAPQISNHEDTEEAHSELPSKRVSSMGGLQLPDVAPEDTSITVFHMTKKKKKLSISEFERAAERRLPQSQAQSALDSTVMTRSLRMSVGSLLAPDTVEKRGLLRRPRTRKALDLQAFEGRVEQNLLKSKAQNYLVDSQSASGIRTSILTSDAEMMLNSTELFDLPQLDEQNQNKLSALEPQLLDLKTSAQRSKISGSAQEKTRLEGLVSSVGTNKGRTQRYSKDSSLVHEHVDRMTHLSPETLAKQQEDEQDHSQKSDPMEQFSLSEEEVVDTVCRWSSSVPSRSSSKCLGSPVTVNASSVSLREVVSHIIEDLEVSDTEEEMINTVNGVEQEKIFREEHGANAGYSNHLEKKVDEEAELQIAAAQDTRGGTEAAPSAGEGLAEGRAHGSPGAEHEIMEGIGAESLGRHSHALSSSEKPGMNPLNETDEEGDQVGDQAIMLEWDDPEEEPAEDEAEDPASPEVKKFKSGVRQGRLDLEKTAMGSSQQRREVSMKTPAFVRAPAHNPLLPTPRAAQAAAPSFPQRSPLKLLQPKPIPKRFGTSQRKPREPQVPRTLIKEIFSHFVKMPVSRDAFKIVEKCCERYFRQLSNDLEVYANHAGRKTVEVADLEVLMRRQGLVTDRMPLHVLIERYLPLEYRKLLIPVAVSGNKVIPCK